MSEGDERELEYYRAIEDLFATLRGVPHILSTKDFQLMRQWWSDEVPLSAVRAGITEVFARRRQRGEPDPVVSLGYCRHAVRSHAKRLAEMLVGAPAAAADTTRIDTSAKIEALAEELVGVASRHRTENQRLADTLKRIADTVAAAADLPEAILEDHLFALESALLANCLDALDDRQREEIERRAREEAELSSATPEALDRAFHALRDRLLRAELGLPRLELGS
jgi:hypothetical protein